MDNIPVYFQNIMSLLGSLFPLILIGRYWIGNRRRHLRNLDDDEKGG